LGLTVRHAVVSDARAHADIYRPIVERTVISFDEVAPSADDFAARITEVSVSYPWLVAECDRAVCGYAYGHRYRERAAYRYSVEVSVYVAQEALGSGVGTALYSALLEDLQRRGFHRAFAGITLPNDASIALHRRFGFEPVGIFKEAGRKFNRWLDVSWWQRSLRPGMH
jgi:phosphinothricin acetyltransferase